MFTLEGSERVLGMAVRFRGKWWVVEIALGITFLLGVLTKG